VSLSLAQQRLEHYLGIMEEYEYELLALTELPEAHFRFQFDTNPHSIDGTRDDVKSLKPIYTNTSSAKLSVICTGPDAGNLPIATLSFDDDNPTGLVSEKTASTITIHFPVKYFGGIYAMLQEAFSNQKHSVKLKFFGKDSFWGANLDFIPK